MLLYLLKVRGRYFLTEGSGKRFYLKNSRLQGIWGFRRRSRSERALCFLDLASILLFNIITYNREIKCEARKRRGFENSHKGRNGNFLFRSPKSTKIRSILWQGRYSLFSIFKILLINKNNEWRRKRGAERGLGLKGHFLQRFTLFLCGGLPRSERDFFKDMHETYKRNEIYLFRTKISEDTAKEWGECGRFLIIWRSRKKPASFTKHRVLRKKKKTISNYFHSFELYSKN